VKIHYRSLEQAPSENKKNQSYEIRADKIQDWIQALLSQKPKKEKAIPDAPLI
jgi:hypothetical protein